MTEKQQKQIDLARALWKHWAGKRFTFDIIDKRDGQILVPAGRAVLRRHCTNIAEASEHLWLEIHYPSKTKSGL